MENKSNDPQLMPKANGVMRNRPLTSNNRLAFSMMGLDATISQHKKKSR